MNGIYQVRIYMNQIWDSRSNPLPYLYCCFCKYDFLQATLPRRQNHFLEKAIWAISDSFSCNTDLMYSLKEEPVSSFFTFSSKVVSTCGKSCPLWVWPQGCPVPLSKMGGEVGHLSALCNIPIVRKHQIKPIARLGLVLSMYGLN